HHRAVERLDLHGAGAAGHIDLAVEHFDGHDIGSLVHGHVAVDGFDVKRRPARHGDPHRATRDTFDRHAAAPDVDVTVLDADLIAGPRSNLDQSGETLDMNSQATLQDKGSVLGECHGCEGQHRDQHHQLRTV